MTFCVMRGPSKSLPPDVKESHDIGGKKAPYLMGLSYRLSEYSHFQTWLMHNCTVFLVFEMWTLKRQEQHQKTVPPLVSLKRGVSGLDGGEITLNEHCVSEFLFAVHPCFSSWFTFQRARFGPGSACHPPAR